MKGTFATPCLRSETRASEGIGLAGEQMKANIERIEVVGAERGLKYAPDLFAVTGDFKFFRGSPDRKIVNHNLPLLKRTMGHTSQFAQLRITQPLYANPDTSSHHGKNQAKRTAGWPKQKQAEKRADGGHSLKNDHHLPVREAMLQKFVMNMFAVGSEYRTPADQPPQNGKRCLQNRQSEGNYWNRNRNDRRRFLRTGQRQGA